MFSAFHLQFRTLSLILFDAHVPIVVMLSPPGTLTGHLSRGKSTVLARGGISKKKNFMKILFFPILILISKFEL